MILLGSLTIRSRHFAFCVKSPWCIGYSRCLINELIYTLISRSWFEIFQVSIYLLFGQLCFTGLITQCSRGVIWQVIHNANVRVRFHSRNKYRNVTTYCIMSKLKWNTSQRCVMRSIILFIFPRSDTSQTTGYCHADSISICSRPLGQILWYKKRRRWHDWWDEIRG